MQISLNWLSSHLDLSSKSIQEISDLFTFAGVEVENITTKGIPSEKIVVAQIKSASQHENADKLKVTHVDCGEPELRQIVCGAKNFKVGDKVPCCLPGTDLGNFVIGETKMRGVASKGMLAAAEEIGLPKGEDGLLILPEDSPIGAPLKDLFESDTLLELEVTPNRPDLLSHTGMARELATLLETPLLTPLPPHAHTETAGTAEVVIESPELCPFYTVTYIKNLPTTQSPEPLRRRLTSIGLRPINLVVDVTNFILHETGQPLHAFDAEKVTGNLIIRNAKDGEAFTALDESTHSLTPDDLVISDSSGKVLALAGIMGGLHSGVTAETKSILLESACFHAPTIRRTSRRTHLSSDSSYRFERGADPAAVIPAAAQAIKLLNVENATIKTVGQCPPPPAPVTLDLKRLHHLLGNSISTEAAGEILTRLGLAKLDDATWQIPSYRQDLTRHIDLVEEITRVHGLANIPSRLQSTAVPLSSVDRAYDADMSIRHTLSALGLYETHTIKLISETQLPDTLPLRPLQEGDLIRVKSPLSEDHSVMRPSLTPGLIATAVRNARQQSKSLRFFELGRVFRNAGGGKALDQESENLAILLSGPTQPPGWSTQNSPADPYDLKAILSALLPNHNITLKPKDRQTFVLSAEIKAGEQTIGVFARLAPARQRSLSLPNPVYLAELDLAKLRKLLAKPFQVSELPQFPDSSRDAAMQLPLNTPNSTIEAALKNLNEPLLVHFECLSHFTDPTGEKIPADQKSLAYRFSYRSPEKTLKQKEVDQAHERILETLRKIPQLSFR